MNHRTSTLFALFIAALWAWWELDLKFVDLFPTKGGAQIARDFFSAAWRPAIDYQSEFVPQGAPPFLWIVLQGMLRTIYFATAAMTLAVVVGVPLSALGSRLVPSWVRIPVRILVGGMRSVHELLWAIFFLAAIGFNSGAAVIALAIPYAGTLAKIGAEMLDETSDRAYHAMRGLGTGKLMAFIAGLLPQATPDLAGYAFYRFECAIRSSAVLGFFGYETAGYYLKSSFENLHYQEVWTWLYAFVLLVLFLEAWSGQLRRRFVA
ncbi:MAG: ABC transporter permease [Planctomycetota bacterium]|nr:ABC transporter permease [Planctomycetota bacterium]